MSKLLAEISEVCRQTGMAQSSFGREAVGDPRFVQDLRNGRRPSSRTVARVRAYMEGRPLPAPRSQQPRRWDDSPIDITADLLRQYQAMAHGSSQLLAAIRLARGEA